MGHGPNNNWIKTEFNDVCFRVTDTVQPLENGTRLYIGLEHIASGFPAFISYGEESDIKSSKTSFESGDLLYGKLRPYLKKSVLSKHNGICSTDILVFRAKSNCRADFLCYLTHWDEFVKYAISTTSGVQHPRTSWSSLREFTFWLPPLDEQGKVATVLNLVKQAIEQQQKLVNLDTELKRTLMHELFTEGLHDEPQKDTEIGLVPESWVLTPLDKTGEIVYGIQAAVASNTEPIGTPILTNKNITLSGKIDIQQMNYFELKTARHKATILQKGDLLFNWRSGSMEHVGKTACFELDGQYTHSSFIIRIRPYEETNNRFLYYYLNYLRESGYFIRTQTYAVNAKFNKSAVSSIPLYVPGKTEQDDIAQLLDIVDSKVLSATRKRNLLTELFRTLLHQLITGQIRVNDIDLSDLEDYLRE